MNRFAYLTNHAAWALGILSLLVSGFLPLACAGPGDAPPILTVDMPLHLEEHLDAANVTGSMVPTDLPEPVEWHFDEPQPDWRPAQPRREGMETVEPIQLDDAIRLPFTPGMSNPGGFRAGAIYVDVPDWTLEDWAYVEIRARTEGTFANIGISFNYTEEDPSPAGSFNFYTGGNGGPLVSDGAVQTYRLSLDWGDMLASRVTVRERWDGPWTHLAVWATCPDAQEEAALEIYSIRVVPVEALYAPEQTRSPQPVEWRFDEPQPDWRPVQRLQEDRRAVEAVQVDDALRLTLTADNHSADGAYLAGMIYVDLPDWNLDHWGYVEIRARSDDSMDNMGLSFNYTEEDPGSANHPMYTPGDGGPIAIDGTVQTYRFSLDWDEVQGRFPDVRERWEGPWTHLAVWVTCPEDQEGSSIDILSIRVVPVEAMYSGGHGGPLQPMEWHFDEPQPDWRPVKPLPEGMGAVEATPIPGALRLPLPVGLTGPEGYRYGAIYVDLPDLDLGDWAFVEIRARPRGLFSYMGLRFNYTEDDPQGTGLPFYTRGDHLPLVDDGTVQTYRLSLDWKDNPKPVPGRSGLNGPWTHLAIWVTATDQQEDAALDILSVRILPKRALYAGAAAGVEEVFMGGRMRRSVFAHAPSRMEYRVRVPEGGRLDVGLGILRETIPVTFRVEVQPLGGQTATLLEESYSDRRAWGQRSVDLSGFIGQTVTLALETDSETPGTVAFWGSPTISGSKRLAAKPNVIFYVIDGAGAEYMSLYGYNRRTTPIIDRLAAEGAVFERAYSNSRGTRPSTASFMTSLQHLALGGEVNDFNVVPEDVLTMAQHLHRDGYQTGVFTSNPNAGKMSGLEREVDFFQENWDEFLYTETGHWRESSRYLHDAYWDWREAYPGEPYWVHFQTVDIHGDFPAVAPFGGLYDPSQKATEWVEQRDRRNRWQRENRVRGLMFSEVWEAAGIDRVEFFTTAQGLYDEAMAYNDYQLGRVVERLKAEGEWENTLLIVAADHGIESALADMAVAIQDSLPPMWSYAMFRPSISRIPLLFVWPGHIPGGQWFREPVVSMVDVLPTVLDLVGLPLPEVMQGQSLAPLLLGTGEVESRPVILDESWLSEPEHEYRGMIEVIDERWGASLQVNPNPEWPPERQRPMPLLLFDLWNDPYCLHPLLEERPDLVEKYTAFLERPWEAHHTLRKMFTPAEGVVWTPEQLEVLRALGYIR
jgi:arylsulfatase A-like enzyme